MKKQRGGSITAEEKEKRNEEGARLPSSDTLRQSAAQNEDFWLRQNLTEADKHDLPQIYA